MLRPGFERRNLKIRLCLRPLRRTNILHHGNLVCVVHSLISISAADVFCVLRWKRSFVFFAIPAFQVLKTPFSNFENTFSNFGNSFSTFSENFPVKIMDNFLPIFFGYLTKRNLKIFATFCGNRKIQRTHNWASIHPAKACTLRKNGKCHLCLNDAFSRYSKKRNIKNSRNFAEAKKNILTNHRFGILRKFR